MLEPLKIVLIDDDPVAREVFCDMLSDVACSVQIFPSGRSLLEALGTGAYTTTERSLLNPDVIILDHYLGDLSGDEVLRMWQTVSPTLPKTTRVIITSADNPEMLLANYPDFEQIRPLEKPFARRVLLNLLTPLPAERGFTLIEILTVTALLALLSAILYGSFTGIVRSRNGVEQQRVLTRAASMTLERLSRDISSIPLNGVPLTALEITSGGDKLSTRNIQQYIKGVNSVSGDLPADSLRLTTLGGGVPQFEKPVNFGLVEVEYELKTDDNGKTTLYRTEYPGYVKEKETLVERKVTTPLSSDIIGLDFRYFQLDNWLDEWASRGSALPQAIEVTLYMKTAIGQMRYYRTAIALPQR